MNTNSVYALAAFLAIGVAIPVACNRNAGPQTPDSPVSVRRAPSRPICVTPKCLAPFPSVGLEFLSHSPQMTHRDLDTCKGNCAEGQCEAVGKLWVCVVRCETDEHCRGEEMCIHGVSNPPFTTEIPGLFIPSEVCYVSEIIILLRNSASAKNDAAVR